MAPAATLTSVASDSEPVTDSTPALIVVSPL